LTPAGVLDRLDLGAEQDLDAELLVVLGSSLETSASSVGTIRSRNSTIVTSTPKFFMT
jgi:hypothetical protein